VWIGVGVLSAGFVLFMLILVVPPWLAHDHDDDHGHVHPVNPPDPAYVVPFQEAKNLIRSNDWIGAKERLLEVQRLAPGMAFVEEYLALVEREIPNHEHLMKARAALDAGELAKARAALDAVAASTYMHERRQKLQQELQHRIEERLRQVWALLNNQQLDQARALLEEVFAVFPDDPKALRLQDLLRPAPAPTGSPAAFSPRPSR
jgi:hypothetical protein